jgi:hypothetical protein
VTMQPVRDLARPRRVVPLRALDLRARPDWLRCSRLELAVMAFTAAALGIACADVAATTGPGRLGMFGLGALTGAPLGFRVESLFRDAGPIFRWIMVCNGFLIATVAIGAIMRWVT